MAYSFDQIFAADPSNPSNVAQNASITIFEPGDSTMTPLTITDPDGQPLNNPIPVNANGFGSAFAHATLDRVAWAGGGFTGFFTSYEGMKQVAVDAQAAAETAAATAGADAAAVATAAIGDATTEAEAAASAAAASATAAANSAALVGAPADTAIAAAVNGTASATKAALNATYAKKKDVGGEPFLGLATALKNAFVSFGVQATGDSTTTPDTAWFRLLANQCATEFPALTHHYRKWNDTTQNFDRPIVLNTGAAGRRAMVTATGGTRTGVKFDGTVNITGDLEVIYNGKLPNYASGSSQVFAAKYDTDNSWYCQVGGDGKLYYNWSTDGTTFVGAKASTAVIPFAANAECWFKIIHDIDNGASGNDVKFYTSTDGVTWTQLGATVTTAGVTTRFASVSRYSLGARGGASTPLVDGSRTYEIQIRDGINGPNVVPALPDMWELTIGTGVPTFEGAPVVTWVMSAQPGAGLGYDANTVGYLMDPVRMKKMAANFNQLVHFFNSSHNEYDLHGNLWATKYGAWVDAITANTPLASRIALTQNPRTGAANTGATGMGPKVRRAEMLAYGQRKAGLSVIDTYQAFIEDGRPMTDLVGDTIHPTDAGYLLEKNVIKAHLDAALDRVSLYA